MNIFKKDGDSIVRCEEFNNVNALTLPQNIIWIDLVHPSSAEVSYIAKIYGLDIPTKEEREEIEQSARYFEDAQSITINTYFLIRDQEMKLHNETVTFILFQKILFTIRYANFKVFNEIQRDILISPKNFEDGFDVISSIFELRVERDADMLEGAAELTKFLRKEISEKDSSEHNTHLAKLADLQELNLNIRVSLFDKRRAIASFLKSNKVESEIKKELNIILQDLNSLTEFTTANLNMLDHTQSLLANQVNIEQNKIIKLFTVATMAMMPPTLIGTIYGMNFTHMPELEWEFSYPIVLITMIISTVIPVFYFKKKGWL